MSGCPKGSPGNSKIYTGKSWKACGWAISKMFFLGKVSAVRVTQSPHLGLTQRREGGSLTSLGRDNYVG